MAYIFLIAVAAVALVHFLLFRGKAVWFDGVYGLTLLLIMGLCVNNIDYLPYQGIYAQISAAWINDADPFLHADKGFVLLNLAGVLLGLDYAAFRFFLLLLPLTLLFVTAYRLQVSVCAFFLLYLMYPFFMDAIQIRNFIIESLLFFCIYLFACKNQKSYGLLPFVALVAAAIQPLMLVYVPFLLFHVLYEREGWRRIPQFFVAVGLIGIAFRHDIREEWQVLAAWLSAQGDLLARAAHYFGIGAATDSRFLKLYLVILLLTVLLYYARKRILRAEGDSLQSRFVSLAYQLYLYQICFFPLFVLDINFATRFPRNLLPIAYAAILLSLPYVQTSWKRYGIFAAVLFLAFYFGLVDLYIAHLRSQVWIILENNALFNLLP
ncbi:MAG: EpsG family protein [Centipeda sp. (in: firmicutes)]